MKSRFLAVLLIVLLVALVLLSYSLLGKPQTEEAPDFFVGIDVAYDNMDDVRELVDEVSSYTNLFVIGSTGITYDEEKLDETCQYLYDKGLFFVVFTDRPFQRQWCEDAKVRWGKHFLGIYFWDENGGFQLDHPSLKVFNEADNSTDAGNKFVYGLNRALTRMNYTDSTGLPLFTSDYTLYWFVYRAGYDVVLAQLGWNYSRQLNIALCRGAATVQNKEWGAILAWTFNHPPYVESGEELYKDLVLAYENGAKYVVVFDSNENYTGGTLKDEHFEALEQFWQYTHNNPRNSSQVGTRVAYVLPENFGYGFRGPNDKIWGLWEVDALSLEISQHLASLLEEYGTELDIIYDDELAVNELYSKYIFWNGTIVSNS
jgi:hypothetical protein